MLQCGIETTKRLSRWPGRLAGVKKPLAWPFTESVTSSSILATLEKSRCAATYLGGPLLLDVKGLPPPYRRKDVKHTQGIKNKSALLSVTVNNKRLLISANLPFYRTLVILSVVTGYPILQAVLKVLNH
jgi:hypothetical protein